MIKAIFFDIDGTLLSFNTHKVPQSTLKALELLKEKGVKVFVSSGRPQYLLDSIKDLEFDGYITLNGAYCFTTDKSFESKRSILKQDIENLIKWNKTYNYPLVFMYAADWSLTHLNQDVVNVTSQLNVQIPQILPESSVFENETFQMMGYFKGELDEMLKENVIPGCELARWHPDFVDIVRANTSKSEGMVEILNHFNFDISQSMAFGDGGNDITILSKAGIGVAMGNASDNVKEAADYVTDSVDEDGIYNALRHFGVID
ncbi:MAG: Cof-type HAD-IIB family hydrolase [Bacteroidales bacterium]|nr:Cof-type HAD-IIB family hydrolase [Bacteroidales bacterium]